MPTIHHSAICVRDIDKSLMFWRDGLGFSVLLDERFEGDWPTLLRAPSNSLRSVFLGDPGIPDGGQLELVDLGPVESGAGAGDPGAHASSGFLLLSVMIEVDVALDRLRTLGLGGEPRRIEVSGVAMAVVADPDGVLVELIDTAALPNLTKLTAEGSDG
jgi:catechol 2,3-dioxygenase-like lactoylglutathione lyase family enzyme